MKSIIGTSKNSKPCVTLHQQKRLALILMFALLFVPAALAQGDADNGWEYLCNPGTDVKTVILFGNGIETRPENAHIYTTLLESRVKARLFEEEGKLGQSAASIMRTLAFCTAYAATSGEVLDKWNSNDPTLNRNDFLNDAKLRNDLSKHVMSYNKWFDEGKNVIVVAHSNGNFLANAAYVETGRNRGVGQFHILAVGTTDDHVAGVSANRRITLYGDKSTEFPGALSANYENSAPECNRGTEAGAVCHDFSSAYLNGDNTGQAIINTIISYILTGEPLQREISIYISPMEASVVVGESAAFTVTTQNTGFYITVSDSAAGCVQNGDNVVCSPTSAGFYALTATAIADAEKTVTATIMAEPAPVSVPDVVGQPQSAAETAITSAGLTVGLVAEEHSAVVIAGSVISQSPIAGVLAAPETAISLVISLGPMPVPVPDVVGQARSVAETAIVSAGLTVGIVAEEHSATVIAGSVISQSPIAGVLAAPETAISLLISLGPVPVPVPDVVGQPRSVAETAITSAGLTVGIVTEEHSAVVIAGSVISQSPIAGVLVAPETAVSLVISLGPVPVSVPDVVGQPQSAAETAITSAGLTVGIVTEEHSATVIAGSVISQSPIAGVLVAPETAVSLVISLGPVPVSVPDVVGQPQFMAQWVFTFFGLKSEIVTTEHSATVAAGSVISQNPVAGALVVPGTSIALTVSLGPVPVSVPNVVGQSQASAETAITSAGLMVGMLMQDYNSIVAAGNVISQNPSFGASVVPGTSIALVISLGPVPVSVPDVVGQPQFMAQWVFTFFGLKSEIVTTEHSASVAAGSVISQNPVAGALVAPGTSIALTVSLGPVPVSVPNVVGQSQASAETAITSAGLMVGMVSQDYNSIVAAGNVISQNPSFGASVAPGTSIALVISLGPAPVAIPDVVGQPQFMAQWAFTFFGLKLGAVTEEHSATVAAGNVIRQSPAAGVSVVPGTSVDLTVSLGPALVGIEVSRNPNKLTYLMGEQLDLTGLQVRNVFDDGSNEQTENYTVSESGNTLFTAGSVPITVISQKNTNVKTSFNINVSNTLIDTGLPVIYINTQNAAPIISKEDYVKTNIKIVSDNPDHCLESTDDYRHEIRGRGNYSWGFFPKKSFRMKFVSKNSLFGLPAARSWVLQANYGDNSLLKNTVAFELGHRMELPFTNNYVHVDVVLNGVYQGSYLVTEQHQVGQGRVNIDENEGFLVEMDFYYDEEPKFKSNILRLPFMIKSPENLTDQSGYDFVKESINELEAALFDPSFPDSGYRDMINMDTFINYILINDIVMNFELQVPASVFMYKDKGGKISAGPLWDFDATFGYEHDPISGGMKYTGRIPNFAVRDGYVGQKFFIKFFEDPVFLEAYKIRWNEKYSEIMNIPDFIDAMYGKIRNSALLDDKRWFDGLRDYDNEIERKKLWWIKRVGYLDADLNGISDNADPLEGKLLILQAYGTGSATDGAASHSFVELYNTTDTAVNLSGYSLQYAAGTDVDAKASVDGDWTVINLSGTIPANGSYLILGKKNNASGRLQIADGSGDINVPTMELSNRAFKVALIHGTKKLTVQNPFDIDGAGKKAAGYIDMVGAVNDTKKDQILGYETAPSRISKQVAARRINLIDTDNNFVDFGAADYRTGGTGMSNADLEIKKPRNASVGAWNPMTGEVYETEEPGEMEEPEALEGKLLILQAYGTGNVIDDGAVSHSFVELYNTTDTAVDLSGYTLQYAAGTKVSAGAAEDGDWTVVDLSGTIPANGSYLILGDKRNTTNSGRHQIVDNSGDINVSDMVLSNLSFKVALIHGAEKLTVQNPFDIDGTGKKAAGYIDMVGTTNTSSIGGGKNPDQILGYEGTPANDSISKQKAVRRKSLTDTDNNSVDFESLDYRASGMSAAELEIKKPRNASDGAWNPMTGEVYEPEGPEEPEMPPEGPEEPEVPPEGPEGPEEP